MMGEPRRLEAIMVKRLGLPLLFAVAVSGTTLHTGTDLRVHEWGTFTSKAGPDGKPIAWAPLNGPSDLPCFVTILNPTSIKLSRPGIGAIKATVRMETPVLYFYSSHEQTARVSVRFERGIITEWYPHARVPEPAFPLFSAPGGIDWDEVRIQPGATPRFQVDGDESHYYAARETDASPIRVGWQSEKFLFYRGLASFPVPITARIDDTGRVDVDVAGQPDISTLVLFQNESGRVGYRVVRDAPTRVKLDRPVLAGTVDTLRRDLQALLVEEGLYQREAHAMVETWRDAWFEQGTRLFYLVPRAMVDAVLPLQIEPQPLDVTRVFVGRIELSAPEVQTATASSASTCEATRR